MISIQEAGQQILTGNPLKFYAMVGCEYGVKSKYLDILKNHYDGKCIEAESVHGVLNMMRVKRMIPLEPTLYVVRYDEEFMSSLNKETLSKINSTKIIGTIVCVYEQQKHANKLNKYLGEYTVSIDTVSPQFIAKYLRSDYPKLSDRYINLAVSIAKNYGHAKNICAALSSVKESELVRYSDESLKKLLGYSNISSDAQIKQGVAARDFAFLVAMLETYPDEYDKILYTILATMVELDKLMDNKFTQSELRQYVKGWTRADVYYMFMHTFDELEKLRTFSSYDASNSVLYLFGLLRFSPVPSTEVMSDGF